MKEFFSFDRRKNTTIPEQIVNQIISYINDFKLIQGTPLPKIEESREELGLSKEEAQLIIDALLEKKYLVYDPSIKNYLVNKPNQHSEFLASLSSIYAEIIRSGKTPSVKTTHHEIFEVSREFASILGFVYQEKVLKIKRIFFADHTPVASTEFYFSLDKIPLSMQFIENDKPHLDILLKIYPQVYKYHLRELNVIQTPKNIKEDLNIQDENSICTVGKYQFFNQIGGVVEYGIVYTTEFNDFETKITDLKQISI
jgi:DNA-binding GntR family transcriptional regulator